MRTTRLTPAMIETVHTTDDQISVALRDGRHLAMPIAWSSRLALASVADRDTWRIIGAGTGVEWPTRDEHIGVWTFLGVPEDDALEAAGFEIVSQR